MDINSVLHFISGQIEKIIGVIAALFIATTALLIFRSIKEEKSDGSHGHGTDAGLIEDALRRVLSQTSVTTRRADATDGAFSADGVAHEPGAHGSDDKDERIATLQVALQKAQAVLKERMETSASGEGGGPADPEAESAGIALQKEVDELRARLSEYEIIEDDIADLAMFKEENARLKQEVDTLKSSGTPVAMIAGDAPAASEPVVIAADLKPSNDKDPFAALLHEAKEHSAAEHGEPVADVAGAELSAPGTGLNDPADTAKMAIEAELLADQALKNLSNDEDAVEVLSNLVDTDKLIDEVNALDAEDLMSEFKDKGKP